MKKLFQGSFFLSVLFVLLLAAQGWGATYYVDSAKGVDTGIGNKDAPVKSMIGADKLTSVAKAGDSLVIIGTPIWGVQKGIDPEGQPIYEIEEGCIQYHLIPGGKMRTVIQVGKKILYGISIIGAKGEIETMIDKAEVIEIIEKEKIK